jgi:hypothetical protein
MKLEQLYPNYISAINNVIGNKNPVKADNSLNKISHFLSLANFKNGFDYYELDRLPSGDITFSIITMLGLKTIVTTTLKLPLKNNDIGLYDWADIIQNTAISHFRKEEYIALKKGYTKKGENTGCIGIIAIIAPIVLSLIIYFI